ncbi:hypothetical protein [Nitrospira sp. Ecomares 2.1]
MISDLRMVVNWYCCQLVVQEDQIRQWGLIGSICEAGILGIGSFK